MGHLLRSRRWLGFTALVVLSIVAFGLLSWWQWSRAEERRLDRLAIEVSVAAPLGVEAASEVDTLPAFTPVRISGTFDDSRTVLVRKRPLEGSNGLWVMTPLTTPGGSAVWILRGWIPAGGSATGTIAAPAAPTGTLTLTAAVRAPEGTEPVDGLPAGQVPGVDPRVLPDTGVDTARSFLQLMDTSRPEADLFIVPLPTVDEGQNISYAVQWILFALVAAVGWIYFLRREAREDTTTSDPAPEPART